jgi:hypothetical protein
MQWDGVEDKTSVAVYAAGTVVLLWLSSSLVGAINNVPLVRAHLDLVCLTCASCGYAVMVSQSA